MRFVRSRLLLDAILFVTALFGILVVGRVISLIVPLEYYFTFQSLFTDRSPQNLAFALVGKMMAPLLAGFACGLLVYVRARLAISPAKTFVGFARRLRSQWSPTVFLGGFFAAFISAWPMILYWDLLANPEVAHLKAIFLLLYVLYMMSYGYVTLLGFLGAIFIRERMSATNKSTVLVSVAELTRVGALWLLTSGVASSAMDAITK